MKRKENLAKTILNSVFPVILAFIIGAVIILAIGKVSQETYEILIRKSLLSSKGFMNTLHYAAPLVL